MSQKPEKKAKQGPLYSRRTSRKLHKIFLSRTRTERYVERMRRRDERQSPAF